MNLCWRAAVLLVLCHRASTEVTLGGSTEWRDWLQQRRSLASGPALSVQSRGAASELCAGSCTYELGKPFGPTSKLDIPMFSHPKPEDLIEWTVDFCSDIVPPTREPLKHTFACLSRSNVCSEGKRCSEGKQDCSGGKRITPKDKEAEVFAGPGGVHCDATEWYAMQLQVTSGPVDKYITTATTDTYNVLSTVSEPYGSILVDAKADQELVSGCVVSREFDGSQACMCPEFLCSK